MWNKNGSSCEYMGRESWSALAGSCRARAASAHSATARTALGRAQVLHPQLSQPQESRARPTGDEHSSFRGGGVSEWRTSWTASSAMYALLVAIPQMIAGRTHHTFRSAAGK